MPDRDTFAREFLEEAKSRGKSKDEATAGLEKALVRFDADNPEPTKEPQKNILEKVLGFIAPRTTTTIEAASGGKFLGNLVDPVGEHLNEGFEESRELIQKAKHEKDPIKKKQLLDESRKMDEESEEVSEDLKLAVDDVMERGRIENRDLEGTNADFAVRKGVGVAGEIGSLLLPGTKEMRGILTAARGTESLLFKMTAAAEVGGRTGLLLGITDPDVEGLQERIKTAAIHGTIGALVSGAIAGGLEVASRAGRKIKSALWDDLLAMKPKSAEKEFYKEVIHSKDRVATRASKMDIRVKSYKDMLRTGVNGESSTESKIQEQIKKEGIGNKKVSLKPVYEMLDDMSETFSERPADEHIVSQIEKIKNSTQEKYGSSVSLSKALDIKRSLDAVVGGLNVTERSAIKRQAQDAMSDILREKVRGFGSGEFADLLDEQQVYIIMKQQGIMQGGKTISRGFIPNSFYDLRRRTLENPAILGRIQSGAGAVSSGIDTLTEKVPSAPVRLMQLLERAAGSNQGS